jgi:hypothetical protein
MGFRNDRNDHHQPAVVMSIMSINSTPVIDHPTNSSGPHSSPNNDEEQEPVTVKTRALLLTVKRKYADLLSSIDHDEDEDEDEDLVLQDDSSYVSDNSDDATVVVSVSDNDDDNESYNNRCLLPKQQQKQKHDRGSSSSSNKRRKTIVKEKKHVRITEDNNEYHPSHTCLDELKEMKSMLWWTKSERLHATQEGLKIVRTFRKEHGKKHVSHYKSLFQMFKEPPSKENSDTIERSTIRLPDEVHGLEWGLLPKTLKTCKKQHIRDVLVACDIPDLHARERFVSSRSLRSSRPSRIMARMIGEGIAVACRNDDDEMMKTKKKQRRLPKKKRQPLKRSCMYLWQR